MKTKISLKDVVEHAAYVPEIFEKYCLSCRYSIDVIRDNNKWKGKRCDDCFQRVAPPTRWRGKK